MFRRTLAAVAAVAMLAAASATAHANHVAPNYGIDVTAVDPSTRTVEGILHCTTPERAGQPVSFTVTPNIDFNQFQPGVRWGIAVDANNVIQSTGDMPCQVGPGPRGPGPGPGPGPDGFDGSGGDLPGFSAGFINRVWKFEVAVDSVESGKLSATIEKVLNLPKKFASQDDELIDQDAVVLISGKVRVYRDGGRVAARALEDAEAARVHGKLLPPQKWAEDEDEQPVPTIRAKKIYLP